MTWTIDLNVYPKVLRNVHVESDSDVQTEYLQHSSRKRRRQCHHDSYARFPLKSDHGYIATEY